MTTISVTHHGLFIDGQSKDTGEVYEVRSPATGEVVRTVARGRIPDADAAVDAAHRAHGAGVWSRRAPEERANVLHGIADRISTELQGLVKLPVTSSGYALPPLPTTALTASAGARRPASHERAKYTPLVHVMAVVGVSRILGRQ